jgi:hypothetical protein
MQSSAKWEIKRLGREADHSLLPIAEVNNAYNYISSLPYIFTAWHSIKHRDKKKAKLSL